MFAGERHRQRHLIEQRLESVMIAAIDDRHVHWQLRQPHRGMKAPKSAADDQHSRPHTFPHRRVFRHPRRHLWDPCCLMRHADSSTHFKLSKRDARPRRCGARPIYSSAVLVQPMEATQSGLHIAKGLLSLLSPAFPIGDRPDAQDHSRRSRHAHFRFDDCRSAQGRLPVRPSQRSRQPKPLR